MPRATTLGAVQVTPRPAVNPEPDTLPERCLKRVKSLSVVSYLVTNKTKLHLERLMHRSTLF